MSSQRVVLTGGTGFIMSYVAERYAARGDQVILFDSVRHADLPDYTIDLLKNRSNVRFISGDITDAGQVREVIQGADIVYHFAALTGTAARFRQEVRTVEVNVVGTLNACQAALEAGVKYFIYSPRPALDAWLTPYTITMGAATRFVQMYHEVYGLPTVGMLIDNCYGPREPAVIEQNTLQPGEGRKMIPTFIEAALRGDPLPVFGDGHQCSDFIFVDQAVDALMKAPVPQAVGHIFEIGNGVDTPVNRVAELILELTGSDSEIVHLPMRTGERKVHTRSDIALARDLLGWEPKYSLREGLKRTIPWYAKQLGLKKPARPAANSPALQRMASVLFRAASF